MAAKEWPDPGPMPEDATPDERRKWRRAKEMHDTEGFRKLPPRNEVAKVDATDRRLQQLRREHTKFLEIHSPAKAAIWLALLVPAAENFQAVSEMEKFDASMQGGPDGGSAEEPSIVALGRRLVVSGLRGDTAAINQIIERIEGKAGLRTGDEDPDDPAKRRQGQEIAERVVRMMTEGRAVKVGKDASEMARVIDVEVDEKVVDHTLDKSSKDDKVSS